jgi:hypothetical protein
VFVGRTVVFTVMELEDELRDIPVPPETVIAPVNPFTDDTP